MSKVLVNETSLNGIASAIREKNGETTKYKPSEMAAAISALVIGGGGSGDDSGVPNPIEYTGDLSYLFEGGRNDWILKNYCNRIKIDSPKIFTYALNMVKGIDKAPSITNSKGVACKWGSVFRYSDFKEIGDIDNFIALEAGDLFNECRYLKHCPNFTGTFSCVPSGTYSSFSSWFKNCYSIRTISPVVLANITNTATSTSYAPYNYMFYNCSCLDEVVGLNVVQANYTSNVFNSFMEGCSRLKRFTFKTKSDGNPYIVSWKNQTIELYKALGWLTINDAAITDYNSGITIDKKITDETNYPTLKNDPDCYTGNVYYSRYNHTSAVETINSLPDASAYLATQSGGTNTIKFRSDAGKLTDGGQVGDLTEEEIAVATAKGWAVVYAV